MNVNVVDWIDLQNRYAPVRMAAVPDLCVTVRLTRRLSDVGTEVITFQISSNDSKAGGGSCFGDSGGGLFLDGYVLGDASYANALTCNALGSYQRDDTEHSRGLPRAILAVGRHPLDIERDGPPTDRSAGRVFVGGGA
jgi:hypothetical protein